MGCGGKNRRRRRRRRSSLVEKEIFCERKIEGEKRKRKIMDKKGKRERGKLQEIRRGKNLPFIKLIFRK